MMTRLMEAMTIQPWRWAVAFTLGLCLFQGIDIWFSGLFYSAGTNTWVPRSNLMQFARSGVPPLIIGAVVFYTLLWAAGAVLKDVIWNANGKRAAFLVVSLSLGPGLVVESILKTQLGRSRPRDTDLFGGAEAFASALWPVGACERNCSFVSGHAALAFWTTAFAFLLPVAFRVPVMLTGLALGFLMGLTRIMEGAHFLSDVVIAGLIVVGLNVWLARRMGLSAPVGEEGYGA